MSERANRKYEVGIAKEEEAYKINGLWDYYEQFFQHEPCQIKIIHLKAQSEFFFRNDETKCKLWKVLNGNLTLIIADIKIEAQKGDEFYVASLTEYQIITNNHSANILEITIGVATLKFEIIEKMETKRRII